MKPSPIHLRLIALSLVLGQAAPADEQPGIAAADMAGAPSMPGKPIGNTLFYLPTRDEPATPASWGYRYRQVAINSRDGTRLNGWWIESRIQPVRGTVVFSHGNAGSMGYHLGFVMWLAKAGYDVLVYDYRGYGRSGGQIERKGMVEDVRAALSYAGNNGRRSKLPVISYGHSLGGAKSVAAIAEGRTPNLQAVITDAAFASYREMALIIGGRLAADLVSDELSPVEGIARISPLPLLVIHGKRDPVVPFSQGLKLFKAAEQPKTMFEVGEGSHGDCLSRDQGAYRKRMLEWLGDQLGG